MKLSNFRIKDRANIKSKNGQNGLEKQEDNHEQNISKKDQLKITNLLESFENILTSFASLNVKKSAYSSNKTLETPPKDIDYRDRFVTVEIPCIDNGKISKKKLEAWIGEVCSKSFSVAFHYFLEKKINEKQMKAFASQNLLRNLSILADNYKITPEQIQSIDETMKLKVLPYLKSKYPLTVENQVSKSLKNTVKSIDNSQIITNDYFYSSEIQFEYRDSARYDDIIMMFLNQLMNKIDKKQGESQESVFKQFDNLMTETFSKTFNQNWMNDRQYDQKQMMKQLQGMNKKQKQKQKYQQAVKLYTNFLINRKISQNTPNFTQQQIKSKNIQIKSPAILRILTKWCEELWQKFDNQRYFMTRTEGFLMFSNKSIGTLTVTSKEELTKAIKKQKLKILQFLKKVQTVNYEQQIHLLENQIQESDETYIQRYEKTSGKFACKVVKNIERFIIDYLNLLIHCLINVSQTAYDRWMIRYPNRWQSRYNLITFNVSDLLRCKYTSKQKEVAKIFNEIERISNQYPEKLKIIRIKDRLSNVTSDIMINARFNNSINCEIQIAVNSSKSDFMECTNKINHYIYELQRARFGPILQICSIWKTYEKKSEFFDKLIAKQKPRIKSIKNHEKCIQTPDQNYLIPIKDPFICSVCSKHYYHNNYVASHMKCKNCPYWKCVLCLINQKHETQNRDFFFKQNKHKEKYKFWKDKNNIPTNGACILINAPEINIVLFKKVFYNLNQYLATKNGDQTLILRQIYSEENKEQFFKDFLVFQLPQPIILQEFGINRSGFQENIKMNLIFPSKIQKCLKDEKQCISIMSEGCLAQTDLKKIFNENRQKLKCITHIEFVYTELKNADFLIPDLMNLKKINFGSNELKDITKILQFKDLQKLDLSFNKIEQIPVQIENLKNLQELKIYNNKLNQVPEELSSLSSLRLLNLSDNSLQKLPQKISQLINLKELILNNNQITQFPNIQEKLIKLQVLNLNNNKIQKLPDQLGGSSLKSLYLSSNKLKILPKSLQKLEGLNAFLLQKNQFSEIPQSIKDLTALTILNLSQNKLTSIPQVIGNLFKLTFLNLQKNKINSVNHSIFDLINLTSLKLGENEIEQIQDGFQKFVHLKQFTINKNKIKKIPSSLKYCPLTSLRFQPNPFETFQFQIIPKITLNEITISNCGQFKNISNFEGSSFKDQVKKVSLAGIHSTEYPSFLFESNYIQFISLRQTKITQISDRFHDGMIINHLNLLGNQLSSLPQSIVSLKRLKIINLNNNNFETFPQIICNVECLEELHMNDNKLNSIHQNIKKLKKLRILNVSTNKIEIIPQAMEQLSQLQDLNAIKNKIKQIPLSLCRNTSLKHLRLSNNLIEKIPSQINQLKGLLNKGLYLGDNPIKQISSTEFLAQKVSLWNTFYANYQKLNRQNQTITTHPQIQHQT